MDNDLFLEHYENYFPKIYSFIFYRIRDKEIAEDLCSQTFLKAYEKLHQYHSSKGEFKTWLFQIARNSLIDHYRQNRHHQDLEMAHQIKDERTDLLKELFGEESVQEVRKALSQLPELDQNVILLRLWDELPYHEIAQVLGKTEGSLRIVYSRALKKLKQNLSGMGLALLLFMVSK